MTANLFLARLDQMIDLKPINPGDKKHRVTTIENVTSWSNPTIADLVDALYRQIIAAGKHKLSYCAGFSRPGLSARAKVLEQRDRSL